MPRGPSLDALSADDWKRLDARLDALLELDADARRRELEQLAADAPDEAALLESLLDAEASEQRLQGTLQATLGYLAEQDATEPGTRIGAWQVVRPIGRGGMAEVYLADRADGAFQRQVALKLIWPGRVSTDAQRLVRQERQILADLDDPRIAGLVDGGMTESGRPWLAMEYVDGEPIDRACRARALGLESRLRLFIQVAEAVAGAHRRLIVHGDLKPANVLLNSAGQVKLLDFGIARLLDEGTDRERWHALTPDWASPEQQRGQPPSIASDVYQLGLLLGGLIDDLAPPGGRRQRELDAILAQALAPNPKRRYRDAERMAADVGALLDHRPVTAMLGGPAYRLRCLLRRRWPAIALTVGLVSVGTVLLGLQLNQSRLMAERNATNEAVLAYLEEMLNRSNPQRAGGQELVSGALLREAATDLQQRLGDQPRVRARVLNSLGRIHQARNEIVEAGERHAEALALARLHDWPDVLEGALEGLAVVGTWGGDYARSEAYLRELLALRQATAGTPALVERTRLQLADLLHSRGAYDEALFLARQAHASGFDPGWSNRVLGMVLRDQGRFDEADQAFQAALAYENSFEPPAAPRLAELSDHRTILALHQGRPDVARAALDTSTELRRGYLGENWDGLLWTRHWNALHALFIGDLDSAATQLDIQLADYARFLGESSHLLAFARSDRAWVALGLGDMERARELFERAAARLESMQAGGHPRLAEVLLGQALIALAEGRTGDARTAAEGALAIRAGLPGEAPGARDWRANACRIVLRSGGRCSEAFDADRRGLDAVRLEAARSALCRRERAQSRLEALCTLESPGD